MTVTVETAEIQDKANQNDEKADNNDTPTEESSQKEDDTQLLKENAPSWEKSRRNEISRQVILFEDYWRVNYKSNQIKYSRPLVIQLPLFVLLDFQKHSDNWITESWFIAYLDVSSAIV